MRDLKVRNLNGMLQYPGEFEACKSVVCNCPYVTGLRYRVLGTPLGHPWRVGYCLGFQVSQLSVPCSLLRFLTQALTAQPLPAQRAILMIRQGPQTATMTTD